MIRILFLVLLLGLSGCTVNMYDGKSRPKNEIASIETTNCFIRYVDKKEIHTGGNYGSVNLLPGRYTLGIMLNDTRGYPRIKRTDTPYEMPFYARAGKTYLVRPVYFGYGGFRWKPEIVEIEPNEVEYSKKDAGL